MDNNEFTTKKFKIETSLNFEKDLNPKLQKGFAHHSSRLNLHPNPIKIQTTKNWRKLPQVSIEDVESLINVDVTLEV